MENTARIDTLDEKKHRRQVLANLVNRTWLVAWKKVPQEDRGGFIRTLVEDHLGDFLRGMSRKERASLMNDLLPLIAREFPLADLDLLSAFPMPQKSYGESPDGRKDK